MATVTPQRTTTPYESTGCEVWRWLNINAGDVCTPVICATFPDKAVQLVGAFGGSLTIEGSINPDPAVAVYATLNDPQGNPLSGIAAAKMETVLEHCYLIRPSAGAGVSATDVWLFLSNVKG
jgi:hypothetical protein